MKKMLAFVGIGLIVLGMLGLTGALTIVQPGLVEDTMVVKNAPNQNWGMMDNLFVQNKPDTNQVSIALYRFDIQLPDDIQINIAYFIPYGINYHNPNPAYLNVHMVESDWYEDLVTWNTKPNISDIKQTIGVGNWFPIKFDVTSMVKIWQSGGANYGMALTASEGSAFQIWSKEYSNPAYYPTLQIDYTTLTGTHKNATVNTDVDTKNVDTNSDSTDDITIDKAAKDKADKETPLWVWVCLGLGVFVILIAVLRY